MRVGIYLCGLLAVSLGTLTSLHGAEPEPSATSAAVSPQEAAELDAIRAQATAFTEAFNSANAQALVALWTPNGDLTDEDGTTFQGREAIQHHYEQLFAEHPGVQMEVTIDSLRLLSSNTAIEDGHAVVVSPQHAASVTGRYVAIHTKVDGQWLLSAVRDLPSESADHHSPIADLDWLIGNWVAESPVGRFEVECRWVANGRFLERTYRNRSSSGEETSGVQIIGLHPQTGQMESWSFNSDGSTAHGIWSPHAGGWSAQLHGTTGEGLPTSAIVRFTRLDEDTCVWQSLGRVVAGHSLGDTGQVHLRRQKANP